MLLTADVGNTNIKLGLFDGDTLVHKLRVSTNRAKTSDEFAVELYTFFQIYNIDSSRITASIISSVVPKVTQPLREAIGIVTGVKSLIIGPGLKTGMELKIDHPETLGADLVCGCVGAYKKYGGPLIMIFMGTANVIAYVDENFVYHGGIIAPGVGISLDALTSGGALLPAVDLRTPKKVIGTNTVDCIRSAMTYGTACMLDGMIDKFMRESGKDCVLAATGGLAPQMIQNCTHKIIFDENIILEGLNEIYKKNVRKQHTTPIG
ncbi:MAG TPA: pantothenate kinase [Ruminococcaceae bacterium]|nr:pantothenate kinase [Oscillospiraceae bacterium]